MFFTRLISGIVLVLAAIFVFVQGGYFLLFALGILSLLGLYELLASPPTRRPQRA